MNVYSILLNMPENVKKKHALDVFFPLNSILCDIFIGF